MRLRHPDGSTLHVGYCTNVHAEEEPEAIARRVTAIAGQVRDQLGLGVLGVGLWLPAQAAATLRRDAVALKGLRASLDAAGLAVVTLNGFPYRAFHAPVVKRAVYRPDWSDPARLDAIVDLAHVLVHLLPDDVEVGSISTLPLGWRAWLGDAGRQAARQALHRLGDELERLQAATGRTIHVGLEPEPGCTLSSATEVVGFVIDLAVPGIGVALDACHLAVEFEDPAAVAALLRAHRLDAVKLQVSNALRSPAASLDVHRSRLADYDEPRFLHQTRTRTSAGGVVGTDDLGAALAGDLPIDGEWRVHVHVPVHKGPGTTQPVLRRVLDEVVGGPRPLTRHLEVETYTWMVLPRGQRPASDAELAAALATELAWTRDELLARGCTEVSA